MAGTGVIKTSTGVTKPTKIFPGAVTKVVKRLTSGGAWELIGGGGGGGGLGGAMSRQDLGSTVGTQNQDAYGASYLVDPTANGRMLAFILNTKASAPDTPTVTGLGVTWTQVATGVTTDTHRLSLFTAVSSATPFVGPEMLTVNQQGIETDASGWPVLENCTTSQSSAQAYAGTYSLEVVAVVNGVMSVSTPTGTSGFAVTPGKAYSITARVRAAATARNTDVSMSWYTSGGTLISTAAGELHSTSSTAWTVVRYSAVAPATAAYGQVRLRVNAAGVLAGETYYWDGMTVREGALAADFAGAVQTGHSMFIYEFTASSTPTIVQSKVASGVAATEAVITLDTPPGSGSNAYAVVGGVAKTSSGGFSPHTGTVEDFDIGYSTPTARISVNTNLDPSEATYMRTVWTTAGDWVGIAVELTTT